jgi:peptide/nickel transport system substrate-binding protein
VASIVPKEAVEKFGDLKSNAIGTGPFMLKEHTRGSHYTFVRNPQYFKKGLPYLDGIRYSTGMSAAGYIAALISGNLDFSGLYCFDLPVIREKASQMTIMRRPGKSAIVLRFSPWSEDRPLKPPLDNLKVRQAIAMAIDKSRLLRIALDGQGTLTPGLIVNFPPYSLPDNDPGEYNPGKAKQLLAEAGYANGFTVEVMTWSDPVINKIGEVIKEMLLESGVTLEIKPLPPPQYINRLLKMDFQMHLGYFYPSEDPGQILMSSYSRNPVTFKWNNPEIWRMVDEQKKILDPQKRSVMIQDIERKLLQERVHVPLLTMDRFWVFQPWVYPKEVYFNVYQNYTFEETWMANR